MPTPRPAITRRASTSCSATAPFIPSPAPSRSRPTMRSRRVRETRRSMPASSRVFCALILTLPFGACSRDASTSERLEQLKSADVALRLQAVNELGRSAADAQLAVPALADALKDSDPFVRRDAARA